MECESSFIECGKCESLFDIEVEVSVFAITEIEDEDTH